MVNRFDELFLWTATAMLLVAFGLAVSPAGRVRLGTQAPQFGRLSWLAMLFAAGMGSGLVFWGVAEPLMHFSAPPEADGAERALAVTYFHWGLHAWAIYAIGGLVIAYFAFRQHQPMSIAAPLVNGLPSWLPKRLRRGLGEMATSLAILAIIFGVAGTLANGVMLLRSGLLTLGLNASSVQLVQYALLLLLSVAFLTSARSGLSRSIRWLSLFNFGLAVVLFAILAFWISLPALFGQIWGSTIDYLNNLPRWSMRLIDVDGSYDWARGWTVIYLVWWIAWTPFVGVFIARISRGRTIREYLLAVILVPTAVSIIWFAVFGGGAIGFDQANDGLLTATLADYTKPLFVWFEQLPLSALLKLSAVVLLFVFLITSADSAAYVLGMLGSGGDPNPSNRSKLLWGLLTVGIAGSLLARNDVNINKAVAIVGAIPFTVVLWLQLMALLRMLWIDHRSGSRR